MLFCFTLFYYTKSSDAFKKLNLPIIILLPVRFSHNIFQNFSKVLEHVLNIIVSINPLTWAEFHPIITKPSHCWVNLLQDFKSIHDNLIDNLIDMAGKASVCENSVCWTTAICNLQIQLTPSRMLRGTYTNYFNLKPKSYTTTYVHFNFRFYTTRETKIKPSIYTNLFIMQVSRNKWTSSTRQ